ncbi:MAG: EAL domain-containing protein, partial [Pseudomonadota bacterium]
AYRVVHELLSRDRSVDVIVAANDQMALSAAKAASALGIAIPQQLMITGFDDTPDATRHAPAITTVRQPLHSVAQLSAELLLDQIQGAAAGMPAVAVQRQVRSELVVRGSTLIAQDNQRGRPIQSAAQLEQQLQVLMSGLAVESAVSLRAIAHSLWESLNKKTDALAVTLQQQLHKAHASEHVHWWINLCYQIESVARTYLQQQQKLSVMPLVVAALAPVKEHIWSLHMDEEFEIRRLLSVQSAIQLQMSACTRMEQILSTMGQWLVSIEARRCYLIGFDAPGPTPHRFASVLQSFDNGDISACGESNFRTRLLLPADKTGQLHRGLLVMSPVFAGSDLFGYVLIDPTGLHRLRLNAAANSIGNAMRSRFLIGELEKQTDNLRQVNHDLFRLANYDALTGLPNRLSFQRYLKDSCDTALKEQTSLCLLFIDLDGFKPINDSLGHEAGDNLLKAMSSRLREVMSNFDFSDSFIARLGGDEFTVVLRGENCRDIARQISSALLDAISRPYVLADDLVNISASIGFAFYPQHGNTASDLLKSADLAMYRAKELGKNRIAMYFQELRDESLSLHEHAQALREALQHGQLQMYYQPRVDLSTDVLCGVEGLMRWVDSSTSDESFVAPPDVFIHVAERSGFIDKLDTLALETCCQQCRAWELSGHPIIVSVNMSVMMLERDNFVEQLVSVIEKFQVNPALLELEITESAAMKNVEQNIKKLDQIRALGVGLSIDDFGTGYSSMNYLKRLPVTNLKVDRSFVMEITAENEATSADAAIVRSVVVLGKSMDVKLIAEGVETQEQLTFIKSLGCDEGQGYFFSKPVRAECITDQWLSAPAGKAA